jgi:CheY-like chemotaxis protein
VSLEALMTELRAVRRVQEEILNLLRSERPSAGGRGGDSVPELGMLDGSAFDAPPPAERPRAAPAPAAPAAVRARRRKSVLLLDDDPVSRDEAFKALQNAEVPVRVATDGNAALSAIANEKPDVIVLEIDLQGDMDGKDVINMIKATMEWVDIPIVLYTRAVIENQREARTVHGADDFINKGPKSAADLVARVIGIFRRG